MTEFHTVPRPPPLLRIVQNYYNGWGGHAGGGLGQGGGVGSVSELRLGHRWWC